MHVLIFAGHNTGKSERPIKQEERPVQEGQCACGSGNEGHPELRGTGGRYC